MKKLLLAAAVTFTTVAVFAQGQLTFGNNFAGTFIMPIFGPDPANPAVSQTGAPSGIAGATAGTTVYGGPLLQGTGYTLQLWAGATAGALQPLYTTTFRTATANKLPAGLISGQVAVTIPGADAGTHAMYQIRVWNNNGGQIDTWAKAIAGNFDSGASAVVQSGVLGGVDIGGNLFTPNASSTDWVSFSTALVPEPGMMALAGLGAAAMLIFRRRK